MKKAHVFAALVCMGCVEMALGAVVSVSHDASKSGMLKSAAGGYDTTAPSDTSGYSVFFGDEYPGSYDYTLGVLKFELPAGIGASDTINSANLSIPGGYAKNDSGSGTIYVKIQRYAVDNNTGLMSTDYPGNATLIDVGVTSFNGGALNIDLTSAVAADVAAGKSYTSYLFSAVLDATGTALSSGGQDDLYYGGFAQGEAITINYTAVPEPASLSLLGVGALAMIRRRRK